MGTVQVQVTGYFNACLLKINLRGLSLIISYSAQTGNDHFYVTLNIFTLQKYEQVSHTVGI